MADYNRVREFNIATNERFGPSITPRRPAAHHDSIYVGRNDRLARSDFEILRSGTVPVALVMSCWVQPALTEVFNQHDITRLNTTRQSQLFVIT